MWWACSTNGDERNTCRVLVRRTRRRLMDNIKMGLREIGFCGIYWIDLAQDRDQ
jgi:hypothetical protein